MYLKKYIKMPCITMFLSLLLTLWGSCKKEEVKETDRYEDGKRIITFSGYEWVVDASPDSKIGPGPNYFSDSKENVWLDKDGKLHLKIAFRNNKWLCSKVTMRQSYGHGRYVFQVDSRVDQFDKNVVGGLFSYKNDQEEIDIEFSKWSIDENMDSQFAIQPSNLAGNKRRYFLNLTDTKTTHWFNWQSNRIDFVSFQGHSTELSSTNKIIQQWVYTGANIPPDSDEKAKINLWLFRGTPPSDQKETEMVISSFSIL